MLRISGLEAALRVTWCPSLCKAEAPRVQTESNRGNTKEEGVVSILIPLQAWARSSPSHHTHTIFHEKFYSLKYVSCKVPGTENRIKLASHSLHTYFDQT